MVHRLLGSRSSLQLQLPTLRLCTVVIQPVAVPPVMTQPARSADEHKIFGRFFSLTLSRFSGASRRIHLSFLLLVGIVFMLGLVETHGVDYIIF